MDPPVPVPPPSAAAEREPPSKRETPQDSTSGSKEEVNGASPAPSAEDISRQAQLLAEV